MDVWSTPYRSLLHRNQQFCPSCKNFEAGLGRNGSRLYRRLNYYYSIALLCYQD